MHVYCVWWWWCVCVCVYKCQHCATFRVQKLIHWSLWFMGVPHTHNTHTHTHTHKYTHTHTHKYTNTQTHTGSDNNHQALLTICNLDRTGESTFNIKVLKQKLLVSYPCEGSMHVSLGGRADIIREWEREDNTYVRELLMV